MADWTIMLHDKIIKRFSLNEGDVVSIGRGKDCNITIDNTAISRQHISISLNSGIFFVSDLGSTNGTFVNGKRISKDEPVAENDNIEFGKFTLVEERHDAAEKSTPNAGGEQAAAQSYTMDIDDETVFVSNKRLAANKEFKPKQAGPQLKVLQGNASPEQISLAGKSSIKIGKSSSCDMILSGWFIGQAQCYVIKRDKIFFLVPQKSWAGTFVNDTKISSEHILRPGDIIKIRQTIIRFD